VLSRVVFEPIALATAVALTSGIPALAEHRDGPAILQSTIAELLHALIQEYARVIESLVDPWATTQR